MNVDTFRDGVELLDELVENRPKDKDIYMYCTGGIRCSVVGPYLKNKGFEHVKMVKRITSIKMEEMKTKEIQLKGGISAYGKYIKEEPENSLFKGKNYVFDDRRTESITNDVLGRCYKCGSVSDHIINCKNNLCHLLFIQCDHCKSKIKSSTCSSHCQDVIEGKEEYKYDYDYHKQVHGVL